MESMSDPHLHLRMRSSTSSYVRRSRTWIDPEHEAMLRID